MLNLTKLSVVTGLGLVVVNDSYTVHYNSPDYSCKSAELFDCKLGWLFYILSEFVLVTFMFMSVLVFNISFTSDTLNGFVLFIQLLNSIDIKFYASGTTATKNHRIFNYFSHVFQVCYGSLNLNFFWLDPLSFCLWKKATACFGYA